MYVNQCKNVSLITVEQMKIFYLLRKYAISSEKMWIQNMDQKKVIPYGRQVISSADIDAVVEVLHSDYLTQGENVPYFEKAVVDYVKAN